MDYNEVETYFWDYFVKQKDYAELLGAYNTVRLTVEDKERGINTLLCEIDKQEPTIKALREEVNKLRKEVATIRLELVERGITLECDSPKQKAKLEDYYNGEEMEIE